MSASVSSWLPFADKLRKDRLCPGGDGGPAPLRPRRSSLSTAAAPELPSPVSADHLSATPLGRTPPSLLFGPRRRVPSPGFAARASTLIRF